MLDSTAPSFCYYKRGTKQEKISFENLKKAIEYCQENHFFITVIYPEDELEDEIQQLLEDLPHIKILPISQIRLLEEGDLLVVDYKQEKELFDKIPENNYLNLILRMEMAEICNIENIYYNHHHKFCRLSIILTDIHHADENALNQYRLNLKRIKDYIYKDLDFDSELQISILTDRITLSEMNNCNAALYILQLLLTESFISAQDSILMLPIVI